MKPYYLSNSSTKRECQPYYLIDTVPRTLRTAFSSACYTFSRTSTYPVHLFSHTVSQNNSIDSVLPFFCLPLLPGIPLGNFQDRTIQFAPFPGIYLSSAALHRFENLSCRLFALMRVQNFAMGRSLPEVLSLQNRQLIYLPVHNAS